MKFCKIIICILLIHYATCIAGFGSTWFSGGNAVNIYNIEDYGAIGDGVTLNTEAFNRAVSECFNNGGGTILVPDGTFLTGTILLQSNVTLHLENHATILGTTDIQQYKSFVIKKDGLEELIGIRNNPVWFRSLILLDNVHNVTITGSGTIDGNRVVDKQGEEGWRGPHGILIGNSKEIKISGIRVSRAGNYNILGIDVEDVMLSNLTISEGSDGIHIRKGKNMVVQNCKFYTSDDAIAGGHWENMMISDCLINSSCNGLRLIYPAVNLEVKDSEIFGPGVFGHRRGSLKNPLVTNSLTGIIIQPGAWGPGRGLLDNIYIHDIRIRDVQTALTFFLNEGNHAENITVENVTATGIYGNACSVEAWPEDSGFGNVTFKNISVGFQYNEEIALAVTDIFRPKTESRQLPYWGMYGKNVKNLVLENVRFDYAGKEIRSVMGFENVERLSLNGVVFKEVLGAEPIRLSQGTQLINNRTQSFK